MTEPSEGISDEGNSENKEDEIANGDPEEGEASEGDVEEPVDEEVVDPTTDDDMTVLGAEIFATGDKYTVTVDSALENCTITLSAEEATEGTPFTFDVTPAENYKITAVSYKVGTDNAKPLTVTNGTTKQTYTIPGDEITGDIVVSATAAEKKKLWANIDNGKSGEWKLTEVNPLPSANGKTYITVKQIEGYDAFSTGTGYYNVNEDDLTGKILAFGAEPQGNNKFTSKDTNAQAGASLMKGEEEIRKFYATYVAKSGNVPAHYEIDLGNTNNIKASDFDNADSLKLSVWADVTEIQTVKVSFADHAKLASVTEIKVNDKPADPAKYDSTTPAGTAWEISAENGSKISFKLTPAEQYTIKEVTAGETVIKPVSNVYTIASLDENTEIDIEYGLNSAKTYGFSFDMKKGSDPNTATMTVGLAADATDADEAADFDTVKGEYDPGKSAQTLNDKIVATFTPIDDYVVTEVWVDTTKLPTKEDGKYEIALAKGAVKKITVVTEPVATTEKTDFTITKESEAAQIRVLVDNTVVPVADGGKYDVPANAKKVAIEITANRALDPSLKPVTFNEEDEDNPETVGDPITNYISKDSGKNTISTYTILAKNLADKYIVDTLTAYRNLNFKDASEDGDLSNVDVSINGKLDTTITDEWTKEYKRDTTLTVRVEAKPGATLRKVTVDNKVYAVAKGKSVVEFTTQLKETVNVTVDAIGALVAQPLKDGDTDAVVPLVKGAYPVDYYGTYTASIKQGVNESAVTITDIELLNGKAAVNNAESKGEVVSGKNSDTATITLGNADPTAISAKKLTLKLTAETGEVFTYTLQVSKFANTPAELTGLSKITQLTDSTGMYDLKTKGDISKITVSADDAIASGHLVSAEIDPETGKLVVVTGKKAAAKTDNVKITIGIEGGTATKTLDIITTPLLTNKAKVEAKLDSATDISMNLTLTDKNKTPAAHAGDLYYKIEAETAGTPASLEKTKTVYVQKETDVQNYTLALNKENILLGQGEGCEYTVKVTLLHIENKTEPTAENEGTVAASSAVFSKKFATLTPKYETKLSVKKGKATLYTGEMDVVIATAAFNKVTTHRTLTKVDDITPGIANELAVKLSDDKTQVLASTKQNGEYATVGKHTIRIYAEADNTNNMAPAYFDLAVTVVQGINDLQIALPSTSLYKAAAKAATLKPTVIYNGDASGKDKNYQPKTKKVEWSIVDDTDDDTAFWSDKVTINKSNGTVTVNKDYIVQPEAGERSNTFRIKAVMAGGKDTIGDAPARISDPITITNEGLDLSKLVINLVDGAGCLESTDPKGNTKVGAQASELDRAAIEVCDTNGDTIVPLDNLTIKSSKPKDVEIVKDEYGDVSLRIHKANTSAKITVTAEDGSKAQLGLTLNVGYDVPEGDLALAVCPLEITDYEGYCYEHYGTAIYDPSQITPGEDGNVSATYTGGQVNRLGVKIMQPDEESGYIEAGWFTNYDLTVKSGGKKTDQYGNCVELTADKKVTVLELKNKKTGKTSTYTLTNDGFKEYSANANVTAKPLGSLHKQADRNAEQTVDIDLTIPDSIWSAVSGAGKTPAAVVDLDWSKLTVKNYDALIEFKGCLNEESYTIEDYTDNKGKTKHKITISFKDGSDDLYFYEAAYAITVSVGSTEGGTFTQAASAAAATIKVEKNKVFTFKPATSYKIGPKDGSVALTGTANIPVNDFDVIYGDVLNANINGKANKFTDYFKVDAENGRLKLELNENAKLEAFTKDDKTGYLSYTATVNKNYYDLGAGTGENLIKITVDLKTANVAAASYTAAAATIANKAGGTADVQILANKSPVRIAYAMIDPDKKKTDECIDKGEEAAAALVSDGKIQLSLTDKVTAKKAKATVYVIPEDSINASAFEDEETGKKLEAYQENGIAVTINLTVVEAPKEEEPDEPTESTVTTVTIKKNGVEITTDTVTLSKTGNVTVTYTAEVTGSNLADTDKGVTWSLEDYTGNKSSIDANGNLEVTTEETAGTLKVKATCKKDPTKSSSVTVTVNPAPEE